MGPPFFVCPGARLTYTDLVVQQRKQQVGVGSAQEQAAAKADADAMTALLNRLLAGPA